MIRIQIVLVTKTYATTVIPVDWMALNQCIQDLNRPSTSLDNHVRPLGSSLDSANTAAIALLSM